MRNYWLFKIFGKWKLFGTNFIVDPASSHGMALNSKLNERSKRIKVIHNSRAATARGRRPEGGGGGLVGRAVDLIRYEAIYGDVFAYVFGDTQVFTDLGSARQFLGRH